MNIPSPAEKSRSAANQTTGPGLRPARGLFLLGIFSLVISFRQTDTSKLLRNPHEVPEVRAVERIVQIRMDLQRIEVILSD
jgi:hypothetical protein